MSEAEGASTPSSPNDSVPTTQRWPGPRPLARAAPATPMQTIYAAPWPIVICFLFAMLMLYWAPWLTTFLPSLI